jgi:hypothetical protein
VHGIIAAVDDARPPRSVELHSTLWASLVAAVTVGAENVFDQLATRYNTNGGYNSQLEDPIGRTWYARFVHSF